MSRLTDSEFNALGLDWRGKCVDGHLGWLREYLIQGICSVHCMDVDKLEEARVDIRPRHHEESEMVRHRKGVDKPVTRLP